MPGISRNTAFKRKWSVENMTKAVNAVKKKELSLREASVKYSVPKSSLHDRVLGRFEVKQRPGPKTILSSLEEDALVSWVLEMADIGYGVTREKIIDTVKSTLDREKRTVARFTNNKPGKDWWYGFLRRHPQLTSSGVLGRGRAKICSRATLDEWFSGYEEFLKQHNIQEPSQIYCCDEAHFPFEAKSGKINFMDPGTTWHEYEVESRSKAAMSSLVCICADGSVLPPFHIYPGTFDANVMADSVPNAYFGFTKDGLIDTPMFVDWLLNRFTQQIPCRRPLVLLLDENPSHFDFTTREFCRENRILLYCLPPSSSQVAQPLSYGFFESIKDTYYEDVAEHNVVNPENCVTMESFAGFFRTAWMNISIGSIVDCFKASGTWPLNRTAISDEKLQPTRVRTRVKHHTLPVTNSLLEMTNTEHTVI